MRLRNRYPVTEPFFLSAGMRRQGCRFRGGYVEEIQVTYTWSADRGFGRLFGFFLVYLFVISLSGFQGCFRWT